MIRGKGSVRSVGRAPPEPPGRAECRCATTPRYSVIGEDPKCGSPTRLIINESGLHARILRSRRAEALRIKKGATSGALAFLLMDNMHIAW